MSFKRGSVEVRGQVYHFKEWDVKARNDFATTAKGDMSGALVRMVTRCAIKEDGTRLYASVEEAECELPEVVDKVARGIIELSQGTERKAKNG